MATEKTEVPPPAKVALRLSKLRVTNVGPVRSADLDLDSDVTFIMGPGNAGKTWLATLAYTLTRQGTSWLTPQFVGAAAALLRERGVFGRVSLEAVRSLARDEEAELVRVFSNEPSVRAIPNIIPQALGFSQFSDLIRHGERTAEIEAEYSLGGSKLLSYSMSLSSSGLPTVETRPAPGGFSAVIDSMQPQLTVMDGGGWAVQYAGLMIATARYVPAERLVFLPVFTSYLNLIVGLARGTGQPFGIPGATGFQLPQLRQTHLDFLSDLGGVFGQQAQKNQPIRLLDFGELEVRPPKVYFKDTKRGAVVDIAVAASGIAQLAGLMSIGEADPPADTLYVEEPELNLHADAQIRVANYLAKLSQRSRVVLTTHSQYVATMLAIALGKGSLRSLRGYYLDPRNDSAEEMLIQPETGSVALPKSIERALEEIGEAASGLSDLD